MADTNLLGIPPGPATPYLNVSGAPATFSSGSPIIYPTVNDDTHGGYLAGKYRIPQDGYYMVQAGVFCSATNPILIVGVERTFSGQSNVILKPFLGGAPSATSNPAGGAVFKFLAGELVYVTIESGTSGTIAGGVYNGMTICKVADL